MRANALWPSCVLFLSPSLPLPPSSGVSAGSLQSGHRLINDSVCVRVSLCADSSNRFETPLGWCLTCIPITLSKSPTMQIIDLLHTISHTNLTRDAVSTKSLIIWCLMYPFLKVKPNTKMNIFFSSNILQEDLFLSLCLIFNYTEDDSQPDCSCLLRQCSICYGEVAFQFLLNTHKQRRWWMY